MKNNYPEKPTDKAKIDSTEYDGKLLGKNQYGTVHLHGPYGNTDSKIKIAYNIGMHPLESKSHRALFEKIRQHSKKLNYQYYIYNISVEGELDQKTEGRMDGQLLAREFVAPHIINGNYTFFVDIHSNKGLKGQGKYEITNFVFAPGFDDNSENYMQTLIDNIEEITYYAPEYRTSPEYITVPVAESGIPTIVYETYSFEPMKTTCALAEKLVFNVDKLEFQH